MEHRASELKLTDPFEIQNLYQLPLTPALGGKAPKSAKTFRLFKLHGSMNWLYSGKRSFEGETLILGAPSTGERAEGYSGTEAALRGKYSLIIPPVLDKSDYMRHEGLVAQWRQAAFQIASASRVFCLGYSLPPSDLSMVNFLRRTGIARNSWPELWIVDLDKQVASRYGELLKGIYRDFHQDFCGTNAVPRFCEWYLRS